MVDPVTSYNRVPPPFDPGSRDTHLDGELGKLEQSTASIISRLNTTITDLATTKADLEAADLQIISDYTAADVVVTNAFTAADAAEVTARDDAILAAKTATEAKTISAGTGLTGGGALSTNPTLTLANTAVTPGSYTQTSITVDAQGRITAASNGTITQRITSVQKSSDEGRATGTTLVADGALILPVAANTNYIVEALLFYTAGGGNIQAGLSGPSGATGILINEFSISSTSGSSVGLGVQATGGTNTTSGTMAVAFRGVLTVSSTAGDASVVWGRASATSTTTVKVGSYLKLIKIEA